MIYGETIGNVEAFRKWYQGLLQLLPRAPLSVVAILLPSLKNIGWLLDAEILNSLCRL